MEPPKTPYRISQIAVVKDIDAAMKIYHEPFGWGPWNVYDHVPPALHGQHLHGKPTAVSIIGAECEVDSRDDFELIQPLEGRSIYKEHLEAHGEGVQHIAMMSHSQAESDGDFKARFKEAGFEMSMGGRSGETIEFFYLDTTPAVHFVTESPAADMPST